MLGTNLTRFRTMTKCIRRIEIPLYLRAGSFYESLCVEDEESFGIPRDCFKLDASVETESDLVSLLRTVRFWGLPDIPLSAFQFIVCGAGLSKYKHEVAGMKEFKTFISSALKVRAAFPLNTIQVAIAEGFGVRAIGLLRAQGYWWSANCCESAVAVGNFERLKFLHGEGCPWDESTTTMAVQTGDVQCLQYALTSGCPRAHYIMYLAAVKGNIEAMKLLRGAGVACDKYTMLCAIASQNNECVRYLFAQGCEYSPVSCNDAAVRGQLACLMYLHEAHELPLGGVATCTAAVGSLPCLIYLHEQGGPWDVSCCAAAARGNFLDCLRYAHVNGCPWDERTLIAAISARSWSCLWYALRNRCPHSTLRLAIFLYLEVYTWLIATIFAPATWVILRLPGTVMCTSPLTLFLQRVFGPNRNRVEVSLIPLVYTLWVYIFASLPHMVVFCIDGNVLPESV